MASAADVAATALLAHFRHHCQVSMASAADVAATVERIIERDVYRGLDGLCGRCRCDRDPGGAEVSKEGGLNGLCGRCRCDTGRIFPMPGRHLQPLLQEPPRACGDVGQSRRKTVFSEPKILINPTLQGCFFMPSGQLRAYPAVPAGKHGHRGGACQYPSRGSWRRLRNRTGPGALFSK